MSGYDWQWQARQAAGADWAVGGLTRNFGHPRRAFTAEELALGRHRLAVVERSPVQVSELVFCAVLETQAFSLLGVLPASPSPE